MECIEAAVQVIAVPTGICTGSMFGVDGICALTWDVVQSLLCLYRNLYAEHVWSRQGLRSSIGVYLSCRAVIAVPIGICTQSMFGAERICAVLLWTVLHDCIREVA